MLETVSQFDLLVPLGSSNELLNRDLYCRSGFLDKTNLLNAGLQGVYSLANHVHLVKLTLFKHKNSVDESNLVLQIESVKRWPTRLWRQQSLIWLAVVN